MHYYMDRTSPSYRLVRGPARTAASPRLDRAQRRVTDHKGGPLLVLAGPGTGKTTTIVEAVAERITGRGIDPGRVLVLTFSRKAAQELRERITLRLDRTTRSPLALTFHSYAYALVRREFRLRGEPSPILLSGPEQLQEVRRMLRGEAMDGAAAWPEELRPLLATRGFAAELRDFLLRAAERGLDGGDLARLGEVTGRPDWVAAGGFLTRYAARFDLAPVPAYDYAEIVRLAGLLLRQSAVRQRERDAYDVVLVDEYQDTDPAQEQLLRSLAGDGRELIAVGDPDQSIYAFRGAESDAISRFPFLFRAPDGTAAQVVALRDSRRGGQVLLDASRRIASRLPAIRASVAFEGKMGHRGLRPDPAADPGSVRVVVAASERQEAALIADTLRRAHLIDGVPWPSMAVLVRSASRQVPALRRALASAGVPVAVSGDDLPLAEDPGTRPLLALLGCALRPASITEEVAADLLTGPVGQTDAVGLRRLRRLLRAARPDAVPPPDPDPDAVLPETGPLAGALAGALADLSQLAAANWEPGPVLDAAKSALGAASRVAGLIEIARKAIPDGGAQEVLWEVWDASGLAPRWQAESAAGGVRGAAADADLDAVMTLFDAAARFDTRMPAGSFELFFDSLTGQEIAGETLARRALREDAVTVLTAHRSKGLEWDVVVVAGVQEGGWPDIRQRGSLLGMDELVEVTAAMSPAAQGPGFTPPGAPGPGAPRPGALPAGREVMAAALASKLLAEERRLFYVAVSRARRQLLVTAVGGEDSEDRPSRFLAELAGGEDRIERLADGGHRILSLPALTAELRRAVTDDALPAPMRQAAAGQLARLAMAGVPGASPRDWYALTTWSVSGPVSDSRVKISPSQVEKFVNCGLSWLLEVAAGAAPPSASGHLGMVIHAAAALAAKGAGPEDVARRVDEIWHQVNFGSAWYSARQRELAFQMLAKFTQWQESNPRELVASEQGFRVSLGDASIQGRVDRMELDSGGAVVIVDIKTGSSKPVAGEVPRHPQLGVYQLAALLGAFGEFGLLEPGGAELVHVGKASGKAAAVQAQAALGADHDPDWALDLVRAVAAGMAAPAFEAKINSRCRTCAVAACCPVDERGGQVAV